MTRRPIAFGLLTCLCVLTAPLAAQEERAPTHIYEAYYKVNFAELPEWNRQYEAFVVPVMEALQEEGVIDGWGHWQHNVGSEYNIRMGIRMFDWASIETFWAEYIERVFASMPAAEASVSQRMVEAHHDEIWNLGTIQIQGEAANNYMYASTFNVNFDDLPEWERIWNEVSLPILGQAAEQGILNGVVLLNHNTGGAHNYKILYLFEEWDDMDDMWAYYFGTMEERHPEDFTKALSMVQAHDDVIWASPEIGN